MWRLLSFLTLFVLLAAAPAEAVTSSPERDVVMVPVPEGFELGSASTVDGTAKAGEDYKAVKDQQLGPVPPDTIGVEVLSDDRPEPDEAFLVRFSSPDPTREPVDERVVIADDDLPVATIADGAALESAGAVTLKVSLTPVDRRSRLTFRAENGSATDGADFRDAAGTLEIDPGASEATLRIPLVDDAIDEDTEQFTVRFQGTDTARVGDDGAATVTVGNEDFRSLAIGDGSVRETDGENAVTRVPVILSAPTFRTVTVQYATLDGLARAPVDYLSRLGTLTFAPGQTQQFVDLAIVSDERKEGTELFGVLLGKPQGATIQRGAAVVAVQDDDAQPNPDEMPPAMKVSKPKLKGRSVSVRVTCPRGEARCQGRLTLFTVADRKAKARSLRRERRLGSKSYTLRGGQARTVKMTLSKTVVAAARASGRLRVRAYALTRDGADNVDTTEQPATLRFKRASRSSSSG
jgi:hypothetical protein